MEGECGKVILKFLQKKYLVLYYDMNNFYKKKDPSKRDLFKIELGQVFPCFHCTRSIPPTHIINITSYMKYVVHCRPLY